MEAIAQYPSYEHTTAEQPITIAKARRQDIGSFSHETPERDMTKAEEAEFREAMHALILSATVTNKALVQAIERPHENGNGATNKRVTWLMAVFAMVTLLGTGGNFLASSGMALGGKAEEIKQQKELIAELKKERDADRQRLREFEVWLQTTREKLSDKGWKLPPLPKGQD